MFEDHLTPPAEVCGHLFIFLQVLSKSVMTGSVRSHKGYED